MKNKLKNLLSLYSLFLLAIIFLSGCKRRTIPEVSTRDVTNITKTSATIGGKLIADGYQSVDEVGICWSKNPAPTTGSDKKGFEFKGKPDYTCDLSNLEARTTYFARAYAINSKGVAYGEEISFTTNNLVVGDEYQGGQIAYILSQGDLGYNPNEFHGLIVHFSSITGNQLWGSDWDLIGTDTLFGKGSANTLKIVNKFGNGNYAAKICDNLVVSGYSDWYLPSLGELKRLYSNRAKLSFDYNGYYWSSSENNQAVDQAYVMNVSTHGFFYSSDKYYGRNYILAVRSF